MKKTLITLAALSLASVTQADVTIETVGEGDSAASTLTSTAGATGGGTYTAEGAITASKINLQSLKTTGGDVTLETSTSVSNSSLTAGGSEYQDGLFGGGWSTTAAAASLTLKSGVTLNLGKSGILMDGGSLEIQSGATLKTDALWVKTNSTGTVNIKSGGEVTLGTDNRSYGTGDFNTSTYSNTGTQTINVEGTLNYGSTVWANNTSVNVNSTGKVNISRSDGTIRNLTNNGGTVDVQQKTAAESLTLKGGTLQLGKDKELSGTVTLAEGKETAFIANHSNDSDGGTSTFSANIGGNGSIKYAQYHNPTIVVSGSNTYTGNTLITSETKVKATNAAAFGSTGTVTVNGTLDLSELDSLDANALTLGDNAWLVLGNAPLAFDGTLTLGNNVKIDLTSYGYTAGQTVTLMTGVTGDSWVGKEVSVKFSSSVTETYALTAGENGSVIFSMPTAPVPEPATATLSLLALAGLAARRRRK